MVASFWKNFCAPVAAFRVTAPCSQQRYTLLCLMLLLSSPPLLPHASAYLKNGCQLLEKLLCPRSGLQGDGPLRPTTIYISLPHASSFFPSSASTCNRLVENGRQFLELACILDHIFSVASCIFTGHVGEQVFEKGGNGGSLVCMP